MRSYRKHDWKTIIANWPESGLSIEKYCQQLNVPTSAFYKYRKLYAINKNEDAESGNKTEGEQINFIDVTPQASSAVSQQSSPTLKLTTSSGVTLEFFL